MDLNLDIDFDLYDVSFVTNDNESLLDPIIDYLKDSDIDSDLISINRCYNQNNGFTDLNDVLEVIRNDCNSSQSTDNINTNTVIETSNKRKKKSKPVNKGKQLNKLFKSMNRKSNGKRPEDVVEVSEEQNRVMTRSQRNIVNTITDKNNNNTNVSPLKCCSVKLDRLDINSDECLVKTMINNRNVNPLLKCCSVKLYRLDITSDECLVKTFNINNDIKKLYSRTGRFNCKLCQYKSFIRFEIENHIHSVHWNSSTHRKRFGKSYNESKLMRETFSQEVMAIKKKVKRDLTEVEKSKLNKLLGKVRKMNKIRIIEIDSVIILITNPIKMKARKLTIEQIIRY